MSVLDLLKDVDTNQLHSDDDVKGFYNVLGREIKNNITYDFFKKASERKKKSALYTISYEKIPRCMNYKKYINDTLGNMYPGQSFGIKCVLINTCKMNKLVITISW